MAYYKVCPYCGANLDPGEICDCRESLMQRAYDLLMRLTPAQLDRLMEEWEKEEAAQGATNTPDGKTEQIDATVSASIITNPNG